MSDLPALWALDEASKACYLKGWSHAIHVCGGNTVLAIKNLARMIEKYEQPPVDPDLIWARDWASSNECNIDHMRDIMDGLWDGDDIIQNAIAVRKMSRKEWGIK